MKKLSMVALAIAVALAFAHSAMADEYSFSYVGYVVPSSPSPPGGVGVGDEVTFTGDIFTSGLPNGDGGFVISSITNGIYLNSGNSIGTGDTVALTGTPGTAEAPQSLPGAAGIYYDNLFYPWGAANAATPAGDAIDSDGLLVELSGGIGNGFVVNLYGTGSGTYGTVEQNGSGTEQYDISAGTLTFTDITTTPEPSSLLLLGTGLFALAFVAFRKSKSASRSGASLTTV